MLLSLDMTGAVDKVIHTQMLHVEAGLYLDSQFREYYLMAYGLF